MDTKEFEQQIILAALSGGAFNRAHAFTRGRATELALFAHLARDEHEKLHVEMRPSHQIVHSRQVEVGIEPLEAAAREEVYSKITGEALYKAVMHAATGGQYAPWEQTTFASRGYYTRIVDRLLEYIK